MFKKIIQNIIMMVTIYTYLIHCQLIGSLIFSSSIALLPFGKSINFVVHQTAFLLLKTLRDKIKHKMFAQNVYRQKILIVFFNFTIN